LEGSDCDLIEVLSSHCLEGLRNTTKNLSQDRRCPDGDSNQAPFERKLESYRYTNLFGKYGLWKRQSWLISRHHSGIHRDDLTDEKRRSVSERSRKRCRNSKLYFQNSAHSVVALSTCLVRGVRLGSEIKTEEPDIEILLMRSVLRRKLRQSQWRQSSQNLITTDRISDMEIIQRDKTSQLSSVSNVILWNPHSDQDLRSTNRSKIHKIP
jgi:hypothetical protein